MLPPVREKRHPQPWLFPPEASLPALDGSVDRLSNGTFLPWLDFVRYRCRHLIRLSQFYHQGGVEIPQG